MQPYSYDRRKTADLEFQKDRLPSLAKVIKGLITDYEEHRDNPRRLAAIIRVGVSMILQRLGLDRLFLDVLKSYSLSPADRKLMEAAAREFSKTRVVAPPPEKAEEVLLKLIARWGEYHAVVVRVMAEGKVHSEESNTTIQAGPFRLIDTGGFGPKSMGDVAKLMEKASLLLSQKGLRRVLYGDVNITNSVHNSTRVLAFYHIKEDTIYVRANLKGKQGPALESILHELGHRLHFKFLMSKDADIKRMYRTIGTNTDIGFLKLKDDPSNLPEIGYRMPGPKGEVYVVTGYTDTDIKLELTDLQPGERPVKAKYPIEGWIRSKHRDKVESFVSAYAGKNHEENFAEMIAHYCLDTLPPTQVKMLEEILA